MLNNEYNKYHPRRRPKKAWWQTHPITSISISNATPLPSRCRIHPTHSSAPTLPHIHTSSTLRISTTAWKWNHGSFSLIKWPASALIIRLNNNNDDSSNQMKRFNCPTCPAAPPDLSSPLVPLLLLIYCLDSNGNRCKWHHPQRFYPQKNLPRMMSPFISFSSLSNLNLHFSFQGPHSSSGNLVTTANTHDGCLDQHLLKVLIIINNRINGNQSISSRTNYHYRRYEYDKTDNKRSRSLLESSSSIDNEDIVSPHLSRWQIQTFHRFVSHKNVTLLFGVIYVWYAYLQYPNWSKDPRVRHPDPNPNQTLVPNPSLLTNIHPMGTLLPGPYSNDRVT